MENNRQTRVLIIGAGLTGLTLAWYLKQKGIDFIIVEKEERPGGVIRTFRENGFTCEAGPNTGVLSNFESVALFQDLEGECTLEIADPEAKRRLIWKKDRWHALPAGFSQAVRTPLFSFSDKLRLLGEPFRPKGKQPMESVAGMVKRRMGKSFLNYAVDPFISGIYAGDPDYLVTRYALPKLYNLEQTYGSFIKGGIKKNLIEKTPQPPKEVFSVEGGLENLIKALENKVGKQNIIYGATQSRAGVAPGGYKLYTIASGKQMEIDANTVVSTVGSHQLIDLFPFIPPRDINTLRQLKYARIVQVVLGFEKWTGCNLNAFGGLVPSKEKRKILGVLFTSSFLSNRAPKEGALLNVFLGGMRNPEYFGFSDKEIFQIVKEELMEMMGLDGFNPVMKKIFRYKHAIPQYGEDSQERIDTIINLQKSYPGLILAGNIHEGIGMADRIAQGVRIAKSFEGEP